MKSETWHIMFTGLSLTCVTAVALFVMVAVSPKEGNYGSLPLVYAGCSAVLAVVFNRAAAWASRPADRDR